MSGYIGLTWDHPRGRRALRRAAEAAGGLIRWEVQPLEGFESAPIADLCARHDLVVMDHPHLGEALAQGCIRPLDEVFPADFLQALAEGCVGPSWASYSMADRNWALPLDAATQVMAVRRDLLVGEVPETFEEVIALAETGLPVAMCLAGPHAILSLLSLSCALDADLDMADGGWPDPGTSREAYGLLARLYPMSPPKLIGFNPIGLLDLMTSDDSLALVPHIYGYVNYSAPDLARRVDYHNAPNQGRRPGSIIGGTGIVISTRADVDGALRDHLMWLLGEEAQCKHIPQNDGQPALRRAWEDEAVNAASGDFYRQTRGTIEVATIRPRHEGYIGFQTSASAYLRAALADGATARVVATDLQEMFARSLEKWKA